MDIPYRPCPFTAMLMIIDGHSDVERTALESGSTMDLLASC